MAATQNAQPRVVDEITRSGGTAQAVLADLSSLEQVRGLADQVNAEP